MIWTISYEYQHEVGTRPIDIGLYIRQCNIIVQCIIHLLGLRLLPVFINECVQQGLHITTGNYTMHFQRYAIFMKFIIFKAAFHTRCRMADSIVCC